jgi:hypothetical protein
MVRGRLGEGVCAFRFNLLDPSSESSERKTREMYLRAKCGCLLEFHRLTVAYVGMGKKTRRGRRYRWLFNPLATYRFLPFPKIVFTTKRLDYIKSRYICSLLLEDIINLVVSRSNGLLVL